MKKVAEKKIARKITKFCANILKDPSVNLLGTFSSSPSKDLCLINAGFLNGFTREEILAIFVPFWKINNLIMLEGKSYCVVRFQKEKFAIESYNKLNGSFCLKDETKPLYLCYLEFIDEKLFSSKETSDVWPNGLKLENNFISVEEEEKLLLLTHNQQLEESQTSHLKYRTVQHYGFEFQYGCNKVDKKPLASEIPVEMETLINKFLEFGLARPNQLTVNHYIPGQGIPLHTDTHSSFEDEIISVSLGSDIVMDFKNNDTGKHVSITLPRRSCLIMTKESRYLWSHGITPRKYDVIDAPFVGLTILRREKRTSLTFRKVRTSECDCTFTRWCDSQSAKVINFSEETANQIERNYVFHVYDKIASHFSQTRHSPWPNVQSFILSFPVGSLLVDIGCGNGKYLNCSSSLFSIGTDRSNKLLEVCRNREHQVVNADCRFSPFRDSIADAIICIAVIHHLTTENRRLQTLIDISRMLVKGGRALIYVWAKEQQMGTKKSAYLLQKKSEVSRIQAYPTAVLPVHENRTNFKHADILVPWKLYESSSNGKIPENSFDPETHPSTYFRFYHVFKEGELEYLCSKVSNISIYRSFYDQGNWCVELKKE